MTVWDKQSRLLHRHSGPIWLLPPVQENTVNICYFEVVLCNKCICMHFEFHLKPRYAFKLNFKAGVIPRTWLVTKLTLQKTLQILIVAGALYLKPPVSGLFAYQKFKQKNTDVYCPVPDNLAQNVQVDVLD